MRYAFALTALLALFLLQPSGACSAQAGGRCETIVYSANPDYPPYHWASGGGGFDGASIELLRLVAPKGVALKPVVVPWKRALAMAKSGEIDLIVSLRVTPERSEFLRFTQHRAFPNPIVAFVRRDRAFELRSWADLKGRQGGISQGDTFGGGFDEYMARELRVEEARGMEQNFHKLAAGRIDYFVTGKHLGEAFASRHAEGRDNISLSPPLTDMGIHFGFSRLSPCADLAEQVSARLKELEARGVSAKLIKKYQRRYAEGAQGAVAVE